MSFILFAYFGPDSALPMTSVVATFVGVFLMFGRNTTRPVRRALRDRFARTRRTHVIPGPYFPFPSETRPSSGTARQ